MKLKNVFKYCSRLLALDFAEYFPCLGQFFLLLKMIERI